MVPHPGVRQFGRYAIVGAGNTVLDSLVYAVLIHVGLGYVVAKLIAAAVALLNGFAFNRRWTFREPTARLKRLPRYVVVQAAGTGANLAVLVALVEGLSLNPLIGQLIALPAVAGITFVGNKLWTFSRTP
jgi:putative flippase GtrA